MILINSNLTDWWERFKGWSCYPCFGGRGTHKNIRISGRRIRESRDLNYGPIIFFSRFGHWIFL